jgi:hypothetical protein
VAAALVVSATTVALVARQPSEPVAVVTAGAPTLTATPTPEPAPEHERPHVRRGSLSINAIPWAKVFLDDRSLGTTPRQRVAVEAGRHRLRLVTAKGDVRNQTVEIAPGKETLVSVDFSRP